MSPVEALYSKLQVFLNTCPLNVAGRIVYFDQELNTFILAVHSTSPEKTQEAGQVAWTNMPDKIKEQLKASNIGFAARQI